MDCRFLYYRVIFRLHIYFYFRIIVFNRYICHLVRCSRNNSSIDIAFVIIGPFREKFVVTVSGLIGERYGRAALGIGGAITAFAFPMWSVATAIAFASAVHVFTGFSLTLSVAFTA